MKENRIHEWCCFPDVEHKFPDMWTDEKQAKQADCYCQKQYDKIEKAVPILLDYLRKGFFSDEIKKALSIALDCMTETEGIYQAYHRAISRK